MFTREFNLATRLLFFIFMSIMLPFFVLTFFLRTEIMDDILQEKQDKLFGLTRQLDSFLEGDFEDLLSNGNALSLNRDERIAYLNRRLRDITDFVASGNPGVGVGYYSKQLDGVLTYGPSKDFQYTVGTSIKDGHEGLVVLDTGKDRVQIGELVRGNIMNCMHPIIRKGNIIGYIWANETVDMVQEQLANIMKRVYLLVMIIFTVIYICVYFISKLFLDGITVLKSEIEILMDEPNHLLPPINGELNIISTKVNELVDKISYMKSYNTYILEAVVSSVLVVSNKGIITHTNRAFFQLFNNLDKSVHGMQSKDVFGEAVEALIDDGLNRDIYYHGEELNLFGKIIKVSSNVVMNEQDQRLGLILIFQDITLIRKYEKELRDNERLAALGEMSLSVVHEIRNPLTSIKGFTQMLQRPNLKLEKKREYLQIMEEELNRVNRLLNDLLLYGGQSPLRKQNENVMNIIDCLLTEHRTVTNGILYEKKVLQDGDFAISLDKHKIIQVFENIINNATDALNGVTNAKLTIGLAAAATHITIVFKDNGKGISSQNLQKIFNPFFTTKDGGTGFGLSICYRIINNHGGNIAISSVEGEFTEVVVTLNKKVSE